MNPKHCPRYTTRTPFSSLASASPATNYVLDADQQKFLAENGYLWVKQFLPRKVTLNVKQRMIDLLRDFDPESTKSIFKTHRTEQQHKDLYFLESGDKIRFFWEEHAFDEQGQLTRDPTLCINKIGHALHTLDPVIASYVNGYLPAVTFDIGMQAPVPVQSMYIFKQPGIGGEVGVHQDSTFLLTEPQPSVHGLWLCIDDTDTGNGCIWVVPKSHADPNVGLRNRFRRTAADHQRTEMVPLIGDGSLSQEGGVAVEAKCGDLLILHGQVVHWSDANLSQQSRHALMVHCVDGQYEWAKDNWLQYESHETNNVDNNEFLATQPTDDEKETSEIMENVFKEQLYADKGKAFPRFTKTDVQQQPNVRQKILNYK